MNLSSYLRDTGMTQAEMARRLGVTRSAVNQWLSGITAPSARQIAQIEDITEGRVRLTDLIPGQGRSSAAATPAHGDDDGSPMSD